MNLSIASTLLVRKDFESASNKYDSASRRIASGSKFEGMPSDLGGISASANLGTQKQLIEFESLSLQNFLNFLETQQATLQQVDEMYQRMETLAFSSLDIALAENNQGVSSDKDLLNAEFKEISAALDSLVDLEVSGGTYQLFNAD